MTKILDSIHSPEDLKKLPVNALEDLAGEIREFITHSVSQTGGHLASNLGVIELTLAMHYVYDFQKDMLVWDVGHQCYAHKILTGRKANFHTLRQRDGLSGFPNPEESEYDRFSVGHAGTAIPTALGLALGAQHKKSDEKVVAFVGDASIVNGVSFEALNNLGLLKRQMLIVLNDNSMAIDVTQGGIAQSLARIRLNHTYEDLRKTTSEILKHVPLIGESMDHALENFKRTLRMAVTPSPVFESLNIPYFGPVDGHDIRALIDLFKSVGHLNTPAILHAYTRKGRGFDPADDDPTRFHSTGPFEMDGSSSAKPGKGRSFTEAFSDAITDLARDDQRVVAITAAMPDGTGLARFREHFPGRYYDLGIAESAAVDVAAGLAKKGMRPFVCIYSTFLQRSFDQIFQEMSLQNLPVVLCIDRAGLVGNDGPTHHGLMDIGFLRMLPHMQILAPACEIELQHAMRYAVCCESPVAIRYPRDVVCPELDTLCAPAFETGRSLAVRTAPESETVLAAVGSLLSEALEAADQLRDQGIETDVYNVRFVKPLDGHLVELSRQGKTIIVFEDHYRSGGFGSALLEAVSADSEAKGKVICLGAPDDFVRAGTRRKQLEEIGVTADAIAAAAAEQLHSAEAHYRDAV